MLSFRVERQTVHMVPATYTLKVFQLVCSLIWLNQIELTLLAKLMKLGEMILLKGASSNQNLLAIGEIYFEGLLRAILMKVSFSLHKNLRSLLKPKADLRLLT